MTKDESKAGSTAVSHCMSTQTALSRPRFVLFPGAFPPPSVAQLSPFTEEDSMAQRGAGPGGGWHFFPQDLSA